jgi:hypothetical protein
VRRNLQLTIEVVRQDGRQQIGLIAYTTFARHIVHLRLTLQLGENPFLRPTTVVEGEQLSS